MKPFNRTIYASVILVLGFGTFGMLRSVAAPNQQASTQEIVHLLNRVTYGPRPGDIERVRQMGIERYLNAQLSPNSLPEDPQLTNALNGLNYLQLPPLEARQTFFPPDPPNQKDQLQALHVNERKQAGIVVKQTLQARIMRDLYSTHQLQEVMTEFWFNHFNIYYEKAYDLIWIGHYEMQAIRPNVFGRFRDLLGATAHHPAMMVYLDNNQNRLQQPKNNTAPPTDAVTTADALPGLNENYAREIMELHTLGVDGGYTQADVIALARILSGWGFCGPKQTADNNFGFCFTPRFHDNGTKQFLGHTITANGEQEGEEALDILAKSPATAHHLSYQLAQYFVADSPPKPLVDAMTQRYLATDGNIGEVLKTMFASQTFWSPQYEGNKYKAPMHYLLSAVRATGAPFTHYNIIWQNSEQMGQPLYGWLTPDGYKNTTDAWLTPDGVIKRINFVSALTTGHMSIDAVPEGGFPQGVKPQTLHSDPQALLQTIGGQLDAQTQAKVTASPPGSQSALILASPQFMYY